MQTYVVAGFRRVLRCSFPFDDRVPFRLAATGSVHASDLPYHLPRRTIRAVNRLCRRARQWPPRPIAAPTTSAPAIAARCVGRRISSPSRGAVLMGPIPPASWMAGRRPAPAPSSMWSPAISTGSLIAPLAFLGPEYDSRLGQLYTRIQATDIYRVRTWVMIPFKDSIASSLPLRNLIESQISQDLMEKIAAEHRKGRRLYVGTTNLDTRRLVVWDLGAIACRPCPDGCRLFRDVLLASCSVPGMMPPVKLDTRSRRQASHGTACGRRG